MFVNTKREAEWLTRRLETTAFTPGRSPAICTSASACACCASSVGHAAHPGGRDVASRGASGVTHVINYDVRRTPGLRARIGRRRAGASGRRDAGLRTYVMALESIEG
jgi:hypothetical protein